MKEALNDAIDYALSWISMILLKTMACLAVFALAYRFTTWIIGV